MSCHECHTKDERIRELEAKVRYLENQTHPMFPIEYKNPPHPDLEPHIDWLGNKYHTRNDLHE